jgi:parvulin-like peptidyl-prolyl isomerase
MSPWSIRMALKREILLLGLGLLVACAPSSEEASVIEQGVVARIDSIAIAADELRRFVLPIPQELRPQGDGEKARREYLRSLIAKRLLQIEGKARGLDTLASVHKEVEKRWLQHLREVYLREEQSAPVTVSEEEMQQYFEENELGRQRQLAGILVDEKERADEVVRQLDAGRDWAELAREYSKNERSVRQGGVLGFVSLQDARRLKIPDEVFRTLPQGKQSGILPMGKQYMVICFLQDSLVSLESQRPHIKSLLREPKQVAQQARKIQSMARELGWKLEGEGLRLLLDRAAGGSKLLPFSLSADEAAVALFTYQGGEVTLVEYLEILWSNPMQAISGWGVQDSAEVMEVANTMVLGQTMLLEASRRAGIPERPEEQRWLEQKRIEFMLRELRREDVIDKTRTDEEEARDFYEEHAALFREPEEFYIVEVLVETEDEARDILKELEQGETLSSLASQRTIRPGMREEAGMMHLQEYERLAHPQFYKAVREAEVEEIVGPVRVREGYSVFRLLHRQGGDTAPFLQVEKRAHAFVRRQKRDLLFEDLVDKLMEKYQDRITVYQSELAAALPDTFLQRLRTAAQRQGEG